MVIVKASKESQEERLRAEMVAKDT